LYTGVVLSLIDWEFRILPDVITLPGILIGFLVSWGDPSRGWLFSLAGVLSGAGSLWLIAVAYRSLRGRDGMGLGDVKYLGMIGAVLGWSGVLWTMMMASLVGSVAGLAFGLWSRMRSNESGGTPTAALQVAIPFGPFLAAAAFAYSLFSDYFLGFLGAAP
jgi:leader peptidase (prepilin peptidase)/N-methyltransferase